MSGGIRFLAATGGGGICGPRISGEKMAKRGYKLRILSGCLFNIDIVQLEAKEFVAHAGNVNCLTFGKKNCRVFVTGGDDQKVNLWSVGKPASLMSLCGHTSPVESAAFDSAEVLVVAGSSSGAIKLWDLEETKIYVTPPEDQAQLVDANLEQCICLCSLSSKNHLKLRRQKAWGNALLVHWIPNSMNGWSSLYTRISHVRSRSSGGGVYPNNARHTREPTPYKVAYEGSTYYRLHSFILHFTVRYDVVRTLTGHRSYCTALEFHPFGEFFASGSMDTNLKIWDIRKKGCIHTYKGHTRGISTIRFTPDGRWVVSGGFDNVVKVWDLTAGKLLHDFKFHEGRIRSIEFHPLEFLLATGSADKTVKFWDLETFEMIGSARREASGVRSIAFHPDGRTLFCGLDDSLKVYSWEPVICHDSIDMGWSSLGDLCIHDGKLLGGAYYENSVAVWVADISLIEPYGTKMDPKCNSNANIQQKEESHIKSKSSVRSTTPDTDSKDIKTIYVDPAGVKSVTPKTEEIKTVGVQKRANRSLVTPNIVPRDGPDGKVPVASRRESMSSVRAVGGTSLKPTHARRLSASRIDIKRMSASLDFVPQDSSVKSAFDGSKKDKNICNNRPVADENNAKELSEVKRSDIKSVDEKFDRPSSPATSSVAIVHGRTRSLVERFERKEKVEVDEIHTANGPSDVVIGPMDTQTPPIRPISPSASPPAPSSQNDDRKIDMREQSASASDENAFIENLMQSHDVLLSTFRSRLTKLQVVRHFWGRKDVKGAISAVRKLPDHSVQADVIGVLLDKMEVITLDLFSCLLPVLLSLLDSKAERHASVSLEMLLKLVAVFGTVIRTTVSGPRAVGVNLHAEERLECCKQCYSHLQNVQKILPDLVKRGGTVARYAQQLNLVLQQT
ncbi:katanin p80 WD40 repeat-containing subunit B1 homolog [Striga asiatica]|uniref:Katanin p80 WD40 repeat-containing subunit B1 homolog n=1 Tax=Striga asiatica TaxID=4170 RepID=A0A5A7PUG4_STRAF|nr:katanin p80 WD40 repeat-containing subunit B1 homolog [Striga asiatica]